MNQSDMRKSILKAIKLISASCNQKIQDVNNLIEAWHIALDSIPDELIFNGMKKALQRESGFIPSVGEFKQLCTSDSGCGSLEDEALESWSMVMKNLAYNTSPVFKNSAIAETIRKMGGWKYLCSMLTSEIPFRKQDFVKLYSVQKRRGNDYQMDLIGSGQIPNRTFIGFNQNDDLQEVVRQIESGKSAGTKVLRMLQAKMLEAK